MLERESGREEDAKGAVCILYRRAAAASPTACHHEPPPPKLLLNDTTAVAGAQVLLVPYRAAHVEQYHAWMSDPAVREATASEELTLEEEYEMQTSWRVDEDKLTFIILSRLPTSLPPSDPLFLSQHGIPQMVGDVNLFLSQSYPSDTEDDSPTAPSVTRAEVELMIAPLHARRHGYGRDAVRIFLSYAARELGMKPASFFARIGTENRGSIALFEGLGFKQGKTSEVFKETEMVWGGGDSFGWEDEGVVLVYPADMIIM